MMASLGESEACKFPIGHHVPLSEILGNPKCHVMPNLPSSGEKHIRPRGFFPSVLNSREKAHEGKRGFPYLVAWDLVFPSSEGLRFWAGRMLPLALTCPSCLQWADLSQCGDTREEWKVPAPATTPATRKCCLRLVNFPW